MPTGIILAVLLSCATTASADEQIVDSAGLEIPISPENQPYVMINGFPEYRVGPGDILEIIMVQGDNRRVENARILPDSSISFGILNKVKIGGLALSAAETKLIQTLGEYVGNPQLQAIMKEYYSSSASVFGAINTLSATLQGARTGPGVYPLKGRIRVFDLILQAGGPTSDARLDQVKLTRQNRTYSLDVQKAISRGDFEHNVFVEHGDVIQVGGISQADRRVVVLGEVGVPGVHNLSTEASVFEAIAAARGFTDIAAANRMRIIRRIDPQNPTIITVNGNRILRGDLSQNVGLIDGDIVVVPQHRYADLAQWIGKIQPILAFGGLVTTEPLISIGGYQLNEPGLKATRK